MKAFFADIKETGLVADRGAKAWGSKLALPTDRSRPAQLEAARRADRAGHAASWMHKAAAALAERVRSGRSACCQQHEAGQTGVAFQQPVSAASAANGAKLTIYERRSRSTATSMSAAR